MWLGQLMTPGPGLSAVVAAIFILILAIVLPNIMMAVEVVPAVFRAEVVAVDPMMSKARHVARDPNHFIVARPVARAMAVVWTIANLDFDANRSNSGGKKKTRRNNGDEQKFVFIHYPTNSRAHRRGQYLLR
jgi:hypothetical protein